MKFFVLMCGAMLGAAFPALAQQSEDCINADPTSILSNIAGDFQLALDPQDPDQHIIFLSNVSKESNAPQDIDIAQLDGQTGKVVAGSLTVIATNFFGSSQMNGPRWMYTPQGQLGIIYVGTGGVHGAYRSSPPTAWNIFPLNYNGSATGGSASVLPNTSSGAYPAATDDPPTQFATYPQYLGTCTSLCYAAFDGGTATDVSATLAPDGYAAVNATQSTRDGVIVISACATSTSSCGLFQAKIDGAGGLTNFKQIASTGSPASPSLAVEKHPVTGTTVVFSQGAGDTIDVWEQTTNAGMLSLIGTVTVPTGAVHYRATASATQVVLNFIVRSGAAIGNYTIPVSATGTTLTVGSSNRISMFSGGTDLQWFPAAGKFGFYYREPTSGQQYTRCWVTP
jgi:hypothetical protein